MSRWSGLACALLVTSEVRAQVRNVEVAIAAPSTVSAPLEASLRELLERLGAEAHVVRVARVRRGDVRAVSARPSIARVWIELSPRGDRCTLIITDERVERALVRRLRLPQGLDEVASESVAHIIQDTVDALLRGQVIGAPREEAVSLVDDDTPPAASIAGAAATVNPTLPAPRRVNFSLALAWVVQPWAAPSGLSHGPELRWTAEFHRTLRYGVFVDLGVRLPLTFEAAQTALDVTPVIARAGFAVGVDLSARWRLHASVAAGADFVRYTPRALAPTVLSEAAGVDLRPAIRLRLDASFSLGAHLSLGVGALLDADPTVTNYFVERGASRTVLASPLGLRPGVAAALVWSP